MSRLDKNGAWAPSMSRARAGSLAFGGIVFIAVVDFASGVELRTFPLYYGPISLAAWSFGRPGAIAAAVLSAAGWFVSNQLAGMSFSHPAIWVANTFMQGASFTIVGVLVASLHAAMTRARALSRIDPLSGLLNRRAFYDEGDRLIRLCHRGQRPATLAYLDLDNFKSVNDTHGHQAGDELLRRIAQRMASSIRASDVASRLGGDEFAVLLPDLGPAEARIALDRLRVAIDEVTFELVHDVSVTIGAVTFLTIPDGVEAMVQMADSAMYAAKGAGKNRVHLEVQDRNRDERRGQDVTRATTMQSGES